MPDLDKLPPIPDTPTPGDVLVHPAGRWRVLGVDTYPDGLRLTVEPEDTDG